MSYNKETGMYEGYIYKIYNDINDKLYIGQTIRTVKKRWANHKHVTNNNVDNLPIHCAMRKYGIELFHIVEIEKCSFNSKEKLKEELDEKEKFYISTYGCRIPNGYNISNGGKGVSGFNCREIISYDPYTGETLYYSSIDEASIENNVPTSDIIVCCKGKKCSIGGKIFKYKEDGIKKEDIEQYFETHPIITQYNLYGEKLNCFYSSTEAGEYIKEIKHMNKSVSTILKNITGCCRGDRQTAYGFVWRKMNDSFDKYPLRIDYPRKEEKKVDKPIDVYTIDGEQVGTFSNINEAFKELGLLEKQKNQALRCCSGYNAMAFGYIWRYHNEPFNKYSCATINGSIRINKYSKDGVFLNRYSSYTHAADSVNTTNRKAISDCCKGTNHYYKGYLWFYINDTEQPDKNKIIK